MHNIFVPATGLWRFLPGLHSKMVGYLRPVFSNDSEDGKANRRRNFNTAHTRRQITRRRGAAAATPRQFPGRLLSSIRGKKPNQIQTLLHSQGDRERHPGLRPDSDLQQTVRVNGGPDAKISPLRWHQPTPGQITLNGRFTIDLDYRDSGPVHGGGKIDFLLAWDDTSFQIEKMTYSFDK